MERNVTMETIGVTRFQEILNKYPDIKIGVLGDFCLDRYFDFDPALEETSLETFRPCHQVVRIRTFPGGAGTVTSNLHALGVGSLFAIGPVGEDGEAFSLKSHLSKMGVNLDHLTAHADYMTPSYNKPMKILGGGDYEEQDRIDVRSRGVLVPELEDSLIQSLDTIVPQLDGLIALDQFEERNEHAITDRVREKVEELGRKFPDKFFFADSRARIGEFRDVLTKPNEHEAARALGLEETPTDLAELAKGGAKMSENSGKPVYTTLGERGILLCRNGEGAVHIPGFQVPPPIDICGAGDSTTSGIVSALCAGASYEEAGLMGCLVASITVQQVGVTGTASPEQVKERLTEYLERGTELKTVS
ncbi:MAG: carbohydrate kinase [Candidatus Omnitrophica bacterium]|nr:carbohydrate kinase [Candidatus Omnitrophota bacterium]MCA9425034.1 carbohydrate kinase [Candidatus Omnitrophota bacterium]MCA9436424.1 carbohydrate kinase [Candidatus Omnitrophota bacterium]MCA9447122.1 carbohydrate kinase [Candidatus Omnitrophota bacterium]